MPKLAFQVKQGETNELEPEIMEFVRSVLDHKYDYLVLDDEVMDWLLEEAKKLNW